MHSILFVLLATLFFQDETKQDFSRLKTGMNEQQVIKCVGNPLRIETFKTLRKGTTDTVTYWYYDEKDITLIFTRHIFTDTEKDRNALLQRIQNWANPKNSDGIKLLMK
jgi:hypothetical protein